MTTDRSSAVGSLPRLAPVALIVAVLASGFGSAVAGPEAAPIFSCTDATGKVLRSDRMIAECTGREQRVLNGDGSIHRVVPPTLTPDERSAIEAREREIAAEKMTRQDAIRRDRLLLSRFPNEGRHQQAREAALEDSRRAVKTSESRLLALEKEKKPLLDEAEFYVGKPLPTKLKTQLDANEAATEALRSLMTNQRSEVVRINQIYDTELARLRKLWSGAPLGSIGVLASAGATAEAGATAASAAQRTSTR